MDQLKCLVVDDEPLAQNVIENYLEQFSFIELVAKCENALDALKWMKQQKIDLVFLDISMPFISGIEFIKSLQIPSQIILTTAHKEFAVESYELNVLDYLLKPISFERFLKAVNKVMRLNITSTENDLLFKPSQITKNTDAFIYLRADRKNIKVNFDDILFIESLKDYIKVVTKDKTIITKQAISSIEENLPSDLFIRIHRSFIVSLKKIESFTPELIQIGKYEIPISRSYRHEVEKALRHE